MMNPTSHAERIGDPGAVIRYGRDRSLGMVNLTWGLEPAWPDERPFEVLRAEGREFTRNRCLVPASEFFHKRKGRRFRFSRVDGDWFYLTGVCRPATTRWRTAYAVLSIEANEDVRPYAQRQMCVLPRDGRMAWLDHALPEAEVLQPLSVGTFQVGPCDEEQTLHQSELSL